MNPPNPPMTGNPVMDNSPNAPTYVPPPAAPPTAYYFRGKSYPDVDSALIQYRLSYEIDGKYHNYLKRLKEYDNILVCDDSGSMNDLADPDANNNLSRWDELKTSVQIILDLHELLQITCSVYFLNRGFLKNVLSFQQIQHFFITSPDGGTNIVNTFTLIEREENISSGQEIRKKLIHLFTDGHPTDQFGSENFGQLKTWLTNRNQVNRTFYSIILCTDDENIERMYRPLEYRSTAMGKVGIPGVDVTMDYRGELQEIRRIHRTMPFSYGDYVVKTVIGAFDPTIHVIDIQQGCGCVIN